MDPNLKTGLARISSDLGNVHQVLFHPTQQIEKEIQIFLREFEIKRGSLLSLRDQDGEDFFFSQTPKDVSVNRFSTVISPLSQKPIQTASILSNCSQICENQLPILNSKLQETTRLINSLNQKEEMFEEQRIMLKEKIERSQEKEKQSFSLEMERKRDHVDEQYMQREKRLREKYSDQNLL